MGQAIELSVSIGSKCCFGRIKSFADALKASRQGYRHYIRIARRAALKRTGSCVFEGMLLAPKIPVRMLRAFDAGRDTTLAAHQSHFLARGLARIAAGTKAIAFLVTDKIDHDSQFIIENIDKFDGLVATAHSVKASGRRKLIGPGKILFRLPRRYPVVNAIEHVIRHDGVALEDVTLPDGPSALNFAVPTLPEPKRALWSGTVARRRPALAEPRQSLLVVEGLF